MRHPFASLVVAVSMPVLLLVAGCSDKKSELPAAKVAASAPAEPASAANGPSFGGVTKVSREVEAVGSTQELAVLAALQSAVAQVNGVRVASQLQSVRSGLDVSVNGQSAGSARSEAFVQKLIAASQGAVVGFEILSQEEITKVDEEAMARVRASDGGFSYSASASAESRSSVDARASASVQSTGNNGQASNAVSGSASSSEKANLDVKSGPSSYASDTTYKKMRSYWKVRVRVEVAQYKAPDEKGRPKIVVALPKTLVAAYAVGDGREDAAEVARAVRGRLSDMLTQTKRFIVLDREFGSDLQAEVDRINSGNVRLEDSARIGQQLATDLILIPTIERFEYLKASRKLKTIDRELVSYSGGGRITLRLINATTGEVVLSESFEHKLASADPSTMPRVIDGKNMAAQMMDTLSGQMGRAIVSQIFPVSVVSISGDQVVLSQGGESLQAGQRWQAVYLGEELKDPQTGRSLGRQESPVGTIRIDRVSTQTSYGSLEEGAAALADKPFKPGSIELRKLVGVSGAPVSAESRPVASQAPVPAGGATNAGARTTAKAGRQDAVREGTPPATVPKASNEDRW